MQHVRHGPPGQLLMSGRTLKALERNVLIPMRDLFGRRRVNWSIGSKYATISGRRVELEGANDEAAQHKIGGMTLAGSLHNELARQPKSYFNEVLARLSVEGAKLFATTNTEGPYHWVKTDYLERAGDLDLRHWKFMIEDNLSLPAAYVDALKKEYTGMWYKRYILGLWVMAAGLVYSCFDPDRHVRPLRDVHRGPFEGHFVDLDYGIASSAMTWSLKAFWHKDGLPHVHTLKEYYHTGNEDGRMSDERYADAFVKWLPERIGKPVVYIDPSASSFTEALKAKKFKVIPANNTVIDGLRYVERLLDEDRFTMDPSCTNAARQYVSYIWDERAALRGEDKPLKANDHCPDRDRYGLYSKFGAPRRQATRGGAMVP